MNKIQFTNTSVVDVIPKPQKASSFVPDWYKDLNSYINGKKEPNGSGTQAGTAKRCVPLFDAVTSGYVIPIPTDMYVKQTDEGIYYEWSSLGLITFHPKEQAPNYLGKEQTEPFPKFMNPWAIKTPKGYSCLFTQPLHRPSPFKILDGIVDTDTYTAPVNFPFFLQDTTFEGLIPAGTPMVQIIPFKRESWELTFGGEKALIEQASVTANLKLKMFDSYKYKFWNKKDYR
jgi:hypothetical protein